MILKKRIKPLVLVMILHLLAIPLVIFTFKMVEPSKFAGLIGGSVFLLNGMLALALILQRFRFFKSFSFYALLVHIGFFVLPMLISRLIHWSEPFGAYLVWSMPSAEFHRLSEQFYVVLLLCFALDLSLLALRKLKST